MASYLITGSSRGIGLSLATQLSAFPTSEVSIIFATARSMSPALKFLVDKSAGKVVYLQLETTDEASVEAAAVQAEKILAASGLKGLDVLVNNAGVMPWTPGGIIAMKDLPEVLKINVVAVQNVTSAFMPLLKAGAAKKVLNVSTALGSMYQAPRYLLKVTMDVPAYKISKAALNMLTVQYALTYADEGFTFFSISPGWLQTDMGTKGADLPVETGVTAVVEALTKAGKDMNGKFINIKVAGWEENEGLNQYNGKEIPW